MSYDIVPGEGLAPAAPLRKVTRLSEEITEAVAEVSGHPGDQGTNCTLIARPVNGSEHFDVGIYRMGPNQYHPRHHHPAGAEFYFITEGSCLVTVDGEEHEAAAGTAIYLPEGTVHAVRTRPDESVTILYGFACGDFREAGTTWLE